MTSDRQRRFRAVLTCSTCNEVVLGPPADYEPAAAFELGRAFHALVGNAHHVDCGGGYLQVTVEEIPAESAGPPS